MKEREREREREMIMYLWQTKTNKLINGNIWKHMHEKKLKKKKKMCFYLLTLIQYVSVIFSVESYSTDVIK
jgi:hypothetical protein